MSHPEYVYLHSIVGRPFDEVRSLLRDRSISLLEAPRDLPMSWLHEGTGELAVDLAGIHFATSVRMVLSDYFDVGGHLPAGRMDLRFTPTGYGPLAPELAAELEIQAVEERSTLITLLGDYRPPYGAVGTVADRLLMHRVAEAGLRRFFASLLKELRSVPATTSTV